MYVRRDKQGRIVAVSLEQEGGFDEFVHQSNPELSVFLGGEGERPLTATDLELVRVLEDLIDALVDKDVIHFTDLPEAAQKKLLDRRETRDRLRGGLSLLGDDDGGGVI